MNKIIEYYTTFPAPLYAEPDILKFKCVGE